MEGGLACKGQHAGFEGKVGPDVNETERQEEMAEKKEVKNEKSRNLRAKGGLNWYREA